MSYITAQDPNDNPKIVQCDINGNLITTSSAGAATQVQGVQANGATPITENPVLIAGSDGTTKRTVATDTTGRIQVVGSAAAGSPPTGNPVSVAGFDGVNKQHLLTDTSGRQIAVGAAAVGSAVAGTNPLVIGAADGSNNAAFVRGLFGNADGNSTALLSLMTLTQGLAYNGASWDRQRNNVDVTLLASAPRTTTQTSADITVFNCKGILVTLDLTASGGAISLTPTINYKDPASGKYINLLTGTTIAATGTFTYLVTPRIPTGAAPYTKIVQAEIGRVIQIVVTVGNANSQTYSVGYTLLV